MSAIVILPVRDSINSALSAALAESGIPWRPIYGMSDLPLARSLLLTGALASGAERIVCIDADIVATADQIKALSSHALVTANTAVTGLYPLRSGAGWAVHAPGESTSTCRPAKHAGLGFCCIHRESLGRVGEELPSLRDPEAGEWKPFCCPFIAMDSGQPEYLADDRSLWRRMSYSTTGLVLDTSLSVGHMTQFTLRSPIR